MRMAKVLGLGWLGLLVLTACPGEDATADDDDAPAGDDDTTYDGTWSRHGTVSAAGDLDGDGFDDVLAGDPRGSHSGCDEGIVYVFRGPLPEGQLTLGSPDFVIVGEQPGDRAGSGLAAAGDLDGDGFDDILISAPFGETQKGASDGGLVYVVPGPVSGEVVLWTDPEVERLEGEPDALTFGYISAAAGDVNGDGFDDVLAGSPARSSEHEPGDWPGAVYLFVGGPG